MRMKEGQFAVGGDFRSVKRILENEVVGQLATLKDYLITFWVL